MEADTDPHCEENGQRETQSISSWKGGTDNRYVYLKMEMRHRNHIRWKGRHRNEI